MRIDRFLQINTQHSRKTVRAILAELRVRVGGEVVSDPRTVINEFTRVELDDRIMQSREALYFMLHKPAGIVSATEHDEHTTVVDLIASNEREGLHIAGRLDLKTTGLLLLTNDGKWSRRITQPEKKIPKVYRVITKDPIAAETAEVFTRGIYFSYENITTSPAQLELVDSHTSRLTIYEGRYHQVKRMFGHLDNEVVGLHRESMGEISLDRTLMPGEYRPLTEEEIRSI
ncbi:MAG: pseudouridine synthase [Amphritea sp.]